MKSVASIDQPLLAGSATQEAMLAAISGRLAAYVSLTKPRLVLLVLVTVAVGFLLGTRGSVSPLPFFAGGDPGGHVAGGGGALLSTSGWSASVTPGCGGRRIGAFPRGTSWPAGVAVIGSVLVFVGTTVLLMGANLLAAEVAVVTFVLYVFVYTPLKTRTSLNTVIGAIPGALPPVIGWSAASGRLGVEAWALFLIVFLWQFPHFLAIAWIYRDDYERAGFRMLTVGDARGQITGCQAVSYALALIPAGLLPAIVGLAGPVYFAGALFLGLWYLFAAARFWREASDRQARRLLRTSFVYLPVILLLLLLNPVPY